MSIWPFNRKQNQNTELSPDVQQYYQPDKGQKVGIAGLLGVGTLLATILLALGLFFGGRLIYRTLFDDNDGDSTETAQQANTDQSEEQAESAPSTDEGEESEPTTPPVAVAPPRPAPTPPPAPRPTPSNLPNTGPADTALLVLSIVAASGMLYYAYGDQATNKKRAS